MGKDENMKNVAKYIRLKEWTYGFMGATIALFVHSSWIGDYLYLDFVIALIVTLALAIYCERVFKRAKKEWNAVHSSETETNHGKSQSD